MYREKEELNYFGSDLNKFLSINANKSKDGLIINNIDCILYDYKKDTKRIRIIECKHSYESCGFAQKKLLNYLNDLTNKYIEIFIVRFENDFSFFSIRNTEDIEIKRFNKDDFLKWINFELEIGY